MNRKTVVVDIDGERMEFEVLVPWDFSEDEAIEYAIEYVMSTIQIEVI